jgi:hypothetical protein
MLRRSSRARLSRSSIIRPIFLSVYLPECVSAGVEPLAPIEGYGSWINLYGHLHMIWRRGTRRSCETEEEKASNSPFAAASCAVRFSSSSVRCLRVKRERTRASSSMRSTGRVRKSFAPALMPSIRACLSESAVTRMTGIIRFRVVLNSLACLKPVQAKVQARIVRNTMTAGRRSIESNVFGEHVNLAG